ncbi:MAG TPA: adenylyltransferase/cytidyltransferase family protein [Gaiellaceae bacterium]|nr:adenylyltransferase/cytidyltransferase family protein [Gaiellaceae bacterium]
MTGLFGGAFDPPHNGHVALAKTAIDRFGLERLLVLVVADPGHRGVHLGYESRFRLAELAFGGLPRTEVRPEEHRFTVDAVRGKRFGEAIFLVGADEFAGFLSWKDPDGVLGEVRLAVATRPGFPESVLEGVLNGLEEPERVTFFEIPAWPVSGTEIRARLARGERVGGLVPDAVAREIDRTSLYR